MRVDLLGIACSFPILGIIFAAVLGYPSRASISSEVAACVQRGCFDNVASDGLKTIITPFIRGTKFEGRLNTSSPPQEEDLNIYVAKLELPGRLRAISCNCAYVGNSIIICDRKFLSTFETTVAFTMNSIYGKDAAAIWAQHRDIIAQVNKRIADVMESWVIGHEIGHAILHGDANLARRRPFTEKQELEADTYFIDKALVGADAQQRQNLSFGLSQFIFAVMGIAFNDTSQGVPHEKGKAIIAPTLDGIHPPWLIRALNLGERMDDDLTGFGFYRSLASDVLVRPGGINIGTLCAFENLRELEAHLQEQRLGTPSN